VFEVFQKISDPPLKKCLRCQGPVKKLLSPPALQFKGTGWYVTDYAAKKNSVSETPDKDKTKKASPASSDKKPSSSPSSEEK
jgi:putative FmdB family regulatory protein